MSMKPRQKAYCYQRVSHQESADSRLGLESQRRMIEEWCEANDVEIAGWFCDAPLSGNTPVKKRPGFCELLDEVTEGSIVILAKLDRLARSVYIHAKAEEMLQVRGATLVSASGEGTSLEAQTPASLMLRRQMQVFSEFEREVIADRTRKALRELKERGIRLGQPPLGYKLQEGKWVQDEEKWQTRQRLLDLVAELGKSWTKIAKTLNREGHTTKRGKSFSANTILQFYKSEHQQAERGEFAGY